MVLRSSTEIAAELKQTRTAIATVELELQELAEPLVLPIPDGPSTAEEMTERFRLRREHDEQRRPARSDRQAALGELRQREQQLSGELEVTQRREAEQRHRQRLEDADRRIADLSAELQQACDRVTEVLQKVVEVYDADADAWRAVHGAAHAARYGEYALVTGFNNVRLPQLKKDPQRPVWRLQEERFALQTEEGKARLRQEQERQRLRFRRDAERQQRSVHARPNSAQI